MIASRLARWGVFYGWVVIGTIFMVTFVSSGTRFSFGAFYDALLDEFGWERALLAGAASLNLILAGASRPLFGYLVDKIGTKIVLVSGLSLAALCMLLLSYASELWHFYVLFTVMSIGYGAASPATAVPLVSRWFVKKRATAQSVASSGGPTGELLVVPVLTAILLLTDWHTAYRVIAAVVAVVLIPMALVLVRDHPVEVGLGADNDPMAEGASRNWRKIIEPGISFRQALALPIYWQMSFGLFVCGFTMTFAATHFMLFAGDERIHPMTASYAMGMIGGVSILSTIGLGYLGDRLSRKHLLALVYLVRGLAFLMLWLVPHAEHHELAFFSGAFLLGLSWGSTTPLTSACIADACGQRNLGTIFGSMFAVMPVGSGLGAFLAAVIFDATGTYGAALLFDALLGALAAVAIYASTVPKLPGTAMVAASPSSA